MKKIFCNRASRRSVVVVVVVGGDGRRPRAPTNAAAVGVMWRAWRLNHSVSRLDRRRPGPGVFLFLSVTM